MRKLVILLCCLASLSTALFFGLRDVQGFRAAQPSPDVEEEVEQIRPPTELTGLPVIQERQPALLENQPKPAVASDEDPVQSSVPSPDASGLHGTFTGYPSSLEGETARLTLRSVDGRSAVLGEIDVTPRWKKNLSCQGEYWISAQFRGETRLVTEEFKVFLPDAGRNQEVHFVFGPPARVEGFIADEEGLPVAGATVFLNRSESLRSQALTDAGGFYTVSAGLRVEGKLIVVKEGFLAQRTEITLARSEIAVRDFVLKRPMRVAGVIRWPFGAPAEDVSLFLRSKATGEQTDTDSDGRFDFTGGPAMNFVLYARAGGESGQDFSGRFELDPERQDLGNLDLVLQRSPSITGALVDDTGLAVPGINIELTAADNSRVTREARTREDGTFTVSGLYPGTYRVTCNATETVLATVEVEPGRTEPYLELRLPLAGGSGEPE